MNALLYSTRYTPRRTWAPMTDLEWHALLPFVLRRSGPGRPLRELRARMDAVFWVGSHHARWRDLPERFGSWGTVARHFRRLTHGGLWQRLLRELAELGPSHPLRSIEHFICRAARRAYRILGLRLIVLARRLGLRAALPGPPWMLPDPDLSEFVFGPGWGVRRVVHPPGESNLSHGVVWRGFVPRRLAAIRELKWWHGFVAGKRRVPGSVVQAWF